jgi:hypothetical protein
MYINLIMCFTPLASIITAIIEFFIAIYLFKRIKNKKLYPLAIFVFLLGLYQLSEFMLCTSVRIELWARIGFISYTFLPIFVYHFLINVSKRKTNLYLYMVPCFFGLLAIFYPNFISYTSCNTFHVTIKSLVFNQNLVLMTLYLFYYSFCPLYGIYIFSKKIKNKDFSIKSKIIMALAPLVMLISLFYYIWSSTYENKISQTWLHTSILIGVCMLTLILISFVLSNKTKKLFYQINAVILATVGVNVSVLYYLIPNITQNFASIFCQFALLYAVACLFIINIIDK